MKRAHNVPQTKVFAHRGFAAKYPENTLPAFTAAIEVGADGIEFDVHMTKDGELVVIHDDSVDRTTDGCGRVRDMSLAEIKGLDAGDWFGPEFAGTRVPTLDETLEIAAKASYPLVFNMELKFCDIPYPNMELLAWERVLAHGLTHRTVISSFDHDCLRRLKRIHPGAEIAVLYQEVLVDPWLYARYLNARSLHPFHKSVHTPELVASIQRHGIDVRVFTVNEADDLRKYCSWGVNAVITERPDVAIAIAREGV